MDYLVYLAFMTKYLVITVELPVNTRQISLSVRSSHGTWYLAVSRPAGNVVGNCEILSYLRSSRRCHFETSVRFRMPFLFRRFAFCSGIVCFLRFSAIPDTPVWLPTEGL